MDFGTNNNNNNEDEQNFSFASSSSTNSHYKSFSSQNGLEDTQLTLNPNNNNNNVVIAKEHMFDKVVTPSDVGKLNRLVIPKQHAEKYFPLDSSSTEKGLLLNFEDRIGKPWRFRYSYWNSSQSYVMTKGWSRFVKDKKLDAGDIVSFQRGVGELYKDRLYIDWRRRLNVVPDITNNFSLHRSSVPWNPMFLRPLQNPIYNNFQNPNMGSIIYLRPGPVPVPTPLQNEVRVTQNRQRIEEENGIGPMVFESIPMVHGKEATKTLRLFGVNMECGVSSESSPSLVPFSLQSRLYNGVPHQGDEFINKGKSSTNMSLDI